MAFKNENVLPLDQETSEFFRHAQKTLNVMFERSSQWTIDRDRNMALAHDGCGHDAESANLDSWSFIDLKGHYSFSTEELTKVETSPEEISITRKLKYFLGGKPFSTPDAETITCIKEALQERGRTFIFTLEHYNQCQLTLIDACTGDEI